MLKIREELDTGIEVGEYMGTVEYDYPKFHLSMRNYLCTIRSGSLVLKEHEAARWLRKDELDAVSWLPADHGIIELIRDEFHAVVLAVHVEYRSYRVHLVLDFDELSASVLISVGMSRTEKSPS